MNKPNEEENILDEFGYFEFDTITICIVCVLSKELMFGEISGDDGSFEFAQKGIDEHVFFLFSEHASKILWLCTFSSNSFVKIIHLQAFLIDGYRLLEGIAFGLAKCQLNLRL
jgi:hypothetical protein